jgi:formylglycine-generating enzyme required for sulfatase activity
MSPAGLERSAIMDRFYEIDDSIDLSRLTTVLTRDSGLMRVAGREFHFAHRIFQEALAAIAVEEAEDHAAASERLLDALVTHHNVGREVASLYVEAMVNANRISELLDPCDIALAKAEEEQLNPSSAHLIWLVAHVFERMPQRAGRRLRRDAAVIDAFVELAARTVTRPDFLSVRDRTQIAVQLSIHGDPRPGVGVDEAGLPQPAWCPVPAGRYVLGLTPAQEKELSAAGMFQVRREVPGVTVELPAFWIARYPVTWEQYRAFLGHADGYLSDAWWEVAPADSHGPAQRQSRATELTAGQQPGNYPVTGVDWYESYAFCRWLSALHGQDLDLPTEQEWEAAARGAAGTLFPWGPEFQPALLNWEGSGMGRAVPVGLFGASESGRTPRPEDMTGNVWEWTRSIAGRVGSADFAAIGHALSSIRVGSEVRRVVRGGCYLNGVPLLRATYRGNDAATSRFGRQSFRMVRRG